jgi:hypothetical protein
VHNLKRQDEIPIENAETAERLQNQIAEFDAQIFRAIADRRKASVAAGRALNGLRKFLGHGQWLSHFNEVFAPTGLKLRTAQRWMKRAKRADTESKNDNVTHFRTAADPGARQVKDAGKQAKAEINAASKSKTAADGHGLYSLPLHMSDELQEATDALRKFAVWPEEEKKIVRRLHQLCRLWGVIKNPRRRP